MSITYQERNGFGEFWVGNEPVCILAPHKVEEDFLGYKADLFVANEQTGAKWLPLDTGEATEAILASASAPGGAVALALTNTTEVQLAGLSFGDVRPFVLNQGLLMYVRFRLATLMTAATGIVFLGLAGDHHAVMDTVAESIGFRVDGASGLITVENDDSTNETSKVTTEVTVTATDWVDALIDLTNPADCKFYINGNRVAAGTTFNMSKVAALQLQPYMRISKPSEAGVGTVWIDKVVVWSARTAV